jgi:Mn2+/Fe2+ NRAMP family transporter
VDEAVALVMAAPVVALALWAVAFAGEQSNSQARAAVAAELAARAATDSGPEAADTAARTALGATLAACALTDTVLVHHDPGASAAVTVVCRVPGALTHNRVCVVGYAQIRPATTGHVRVPCPEP